MDPILVINENKVEAVKFSPCENYIVLYCPKKDMPYIIWNFITGKMIREFDQFENEDGNEHYTLIHKKSEDSEYSDDSDDSDEEWEYY